MFVDFFKLNIYALPIMFIIECRVVISIWKCSRIFFKHVSLQCLLFDISVHWKYSYGYEQFQDIMIFDTLSLKYEYLIMYNSMRLIKGLSGLYLKVKLLSHTILPILNNGTWSKFQQVAWANAIH